MQELRGQGPAEEGRQGGQMPALRRHRTTVTMVIPCSVFSCEWLGGAGRSRSNEMPGRAWRRIVPGIAMRSIRARLMDIMRWRYATSGGFDFAGAKPDRFCEDQFMKLILT